MTEDYFLRLWINRDTIPTDFAEEEETLRKLRTLRGYTPEGIVQKVKELVPNLNAIEIRDGACGIVVYLTPFSDDIHG